MVGELRPKLLKLVFTVYLLTQKCSGVEFIDLADYTRNIADRRRTGSKPQGPKDDDPSERRRNYRFALRQNERPQNNENIPGDDKDENIKMKIATLVQQTVHDTEEKIRSLDHLKQSVRNEPPYKVGFIISMISKERGVLNELFNVAIKHRDQWKALEQLKIFELIVHTNVDTTNLVRQMVEIHVQYLNATHFMGRDARKRVVLL